MTTLPRNLAPTPAKALLIFEGPPTRWVGPLLPGPARDPGKARREGTPSTPGLATLDSPASTCLYGNGFSEESSKADLQPQHPALTHSYPQMPTHQQAHTSPAIQPPPTQWSPKTLAEKGTRTQTQILEHTSLSKLGPISPTVPAACPQPCLRTQPRPQVGAVRKVVHSPSHQSGPGSAERARHLPHHIPTQTWTGTGRKPHPQSSQVDPGPCTP